MSEEKKIINEIDERLSNDYVVLEGDEDTLYVKCRETGKHYAIHVAECIE